MGLAKLYHPERVEHDIAARDRTGALVHWLTSAVDTVDGARPLRRSARGGRMMFETTAEGLRDYAESRIVPLREFAANGRLPPEDVRAVIRSPDGALLADIRCDGTLLLPDDIDPQVRRRYVSMLNGVLPLAIRDVDRGEYLAALAAIGGARRVLDDLIAEVAALATAGPETMGWDEVGKALGLPADTARQWYGPRPAVADETA